MYKMIVFQIDQMQYLIYFIYCGFIQYLCAQIKNKSYINIIHKLYIPVCKVDVRSINSNNKSDFDKFNPKSSIYELNSVSSPTKTESIKPAFILSLNDS